MIFVWLSIALVVIALVWLLVRAVKEMHGVKDKVIRCSKSAEVLRKNAESILKMNETLQEKASDIKKVFDEECQDLYYVKDQSQVLVGTLRESKEHVVDAYQRISRKMGV